MNVDPSSIESQAEELLGHELSYDEWGWLVLVCVDAESPEKALKEFAWWMDDRPLFVVEKN